MCSSKFTSSLGLANTFPSPAGLVSAASTSTPKNFAAVKHFRGPGPSLPRYMEGRDDLEAADAGAAAGETHDPANGADLATFAAAFLAAFSAFLAAFLLGPEDDGGTSPCQHRRRWRCERVNKQYFHSLRREGSTSSNAGREDQLPTDSNGNSGIQSMTLSTHILPRISRHPSRAPSPKHGKLAKRALNNTFRFPFHLQKFPEGKPCLFTVVLDRRT